MKKIKVGYTDFYPTCDFKNDFIFSLLSKHYDIELTNENPDYLFFSLMGNENLKYDCIKIFYTGENICPDFNLCDYAIGFEYMDYGDRYIRMPIFYPMANTDFDDMLKRVNFTKQELQKKQGFCSFVYSNGNASPIRKKMYDMLNSYKPVLSGGGYLNNVGGRVENKNKFQNTCKFSIAFENSSHPGYCTEKLMQSFAAKTIPIYWGDPRVGEVFNTKAFINCHDYNSLEDVLEFVKKVDTNDELYMQIMSEKPLLSIKDNYENKMKEVEDFLVHIIEQPLEEAVRYNRTFWGEIYIKRYRSWKKAFDVMPINLAKKLYRYCRAKIK